MRINLFYYRLLRFLDQSSYTTLIYGAGWKIVSSINNFNRQFPFGDDKDTFKYFGDLDREGIKIWHNLYNRYNVELEIKFYSELLNCTYSIGKETQIPNKESVKDFCKLMNLDIEDMLNQMFENNKYIPQEALDDTVIKRIIGVSDGK
ncbi:MAG: hypothetical protein WBA54_10525 [Acidaminobacteraceae bacterium]